MVALSHRCWLVSSSVFKKPMEALFRMYFLGPIDGLMKRITCRISGILGVGDELTAAVVSEPDVMDVPEAEVVEFPSGVGSKVPGLEVASVPRLEVVKISGPKVVVRLSLDRTRELDGNGDPDTEDGSKGTRDSEVGFESPAWVSVTVGKDLVSLVGTGTIMSDRYVKHQLAGASGSAALVNRMAAVAKTQANAVV